MSVDRKHDIIDALDKLRKKETAEKNTWKARAYAVVIKQLKEFQGPIYTIEDIKGVSGVGDKIKSKIAEIITTGHLQQAESYNADPKFKVIEDLLKIHAIGPAKAKELVEEHHIKSVEELKEKQHLLNDKQKMGLKYYGEFDIRIPRAEMDKHNELIKDLIAKVDPKYIVELTGSYRRQEKDSGDIDVLITHPEKTIDHEENFKKIVALFQQEKYITDIFAQGNKKCLAVCKAKRFKHFRRLDLMMTDQHEFPFALLYFTGSANFNVEMRNIALDKGYSMSEYGLKCTSGDRKGEYVNALFTTEQDVFEFLGLNFVPPQDRKSNILHTFKK